MNQRSLRLERPLVSIDLETTGLNVGSDRIVEVCCVKIHPSGGREMLTRRLNPGMPISHEASRVHGISNDDVSNEPTFEQFAQRLHDFIAGCDLTGFNLERFDLPILVREFGRADMTFPSAPIRVVDSRRIFMAKEPRTLAAAYQFYCDRELVNAHTAESDAIAAADILLAQVERYDDLPTALDELHAYCHPANPDWLDSDGKLRWRGDEAVIAFGRHRDRPLAEMARDEADYLKWIMSSDFSQEVKTIVGAALDGRMPSPRAA